MGGSDGQRNGEKPVDFMAHFAGSEQFERVFREGMGLVEETADYLDGPGRADSRLLDRAGAIAYATESMRLTTRLMQLASWLLLQRAIHSGEITQADAQAEKRRISLEEVGAGSAVAGSELIPEGLSALIQRSLRLHERILMLDRSIHQPPAAAEPPENPVSQHMDMLKRAFGQR